MFFFFFCPLKKANGHQTKGLMRNHINPITKIEFLACFKATFESCIAPSNILRGFRGAGLVLLDLQAVIKHCDSRASTPVELIIEDNTWLSKTSSNTLKLGSQSRPIKERFQRYIEILSSSLLDTLSKFTKSAEMAAHSLVLMKE